MNRAEEIIEASRDLVAQAKRGVVDGEQPNNFEALAFILGASEAEGRKVFDHGLEFTANRLAQALEHRMLTGLQDPNIIPYVTRFALLCGIELGVAAERTLTAAANGVCPNCSAEGDVVPLPEERYSCTGCGARWKGRRDNA